MRHLCVEREGGYRRSVEGAAVLEQHPMQRRHLQSTRKAESVPSGTAPASASELDTTAEKLGATAGEGVAKQDAYGRTLDEGLAEDRRHRARLLRKARKVVEGMRTCDAAARAAKGVVERSWLPLTWLISSLLPRTFGAFAGIGLLFCCGCGLPLLYLIAGVGALFLGLGVFATAGGLVTWIVAVCTRKLLSWYLKWLVPW